MKTKIGEKRKVSKLMMHQEIMSKLCNCNIFADILNLESCDSCTNLESERFIVCKNSSTGVLFSILFFFNEKNNIYIYKINKM